MIFPAINLHLWLGFSMAMLNNQRVYIIKDYNWLVVSTPLKNMKVKEKHDIPYMKWKIKNV